MIFIKKVLIFIFKPTVFKIGLIITFLFVFLSFFQGKAGFLNFLNTVELKYLDFRFQNRGFIEPGDNIAIVAVDEKSIQNIGRWPWSRDVIARLIDKLDSYGAKLIVFDAFFSEEDSNKVLPSLNDIKKEYLKITKNRPDRRLIRFIEQNGEKSDTDKNLVKAIERSSEKTILGYAFFLDEREVTGIDPSTFEEHFKNIEDSQLQIVFAPGSDEKLTDKKTYQTAKGILSNHKRFSEKTPNHAFVNARPDHDGPIRKSFMFLTYEQESETYYFPSLALKSVMKFLDEEAILRLTYDKQIFQATKVEEISFACIPAENKGSDKIKQLGIFACPLNPDGSENQEAKITIPVDEEGRFLINHRGPAKTFPHYSVYDVLDKSDKIIASYSTEDKEVAKKEAFKNKIVLFGATAIGVFDLRNTPFSPVFPGVEIHANVIDNILQGDFLKRGDDIWMYEFFVILLSGIVLSVLFVNLPALWSAVITAGTLVLYWYIDKTYFFSKGTWVHIVIPSFQVLAMYFSINLFKYMTEEKQKRLIKGAFQQYVAADVVNEMLKDPSKLQLGGEKKEITVLFSDIRSFTTISEGLEPQELGKFLNMYLSPMTDIVIENLGTIDKYMGDAIMAMFGAPIFQANHAVLACRTALKMMLGLGKLRDEWGAKNYPSSIVTLDIGIGLNTGFATVGNMGSTQIFDYTCMGDNVNLGSRLEGINKEYKTNIIISEFTNEKIKDHKFNTRKIDLVKVKGKAKPVAIFELLSEGQPTQQIEDKIGYFAKGFEAYQKQNWDEAVKEFESSIKASNDHPAKVFVERCKYYKQNPPGDDWKGVHEMTSK